MSVYCISYTLANTNSEKLDEVIKSYKTWWHSSTTVWFIETNDDAKTVLENLLKFVSGGDKLIVLEVKKNWWASGFTEEEYNWLKQRNF